MENRSGLIVATTLTKATGTAEREAAEETARAQQPALPVVGFVNSGGSTQTGRNLMRLGNTNVPRISAWT